MTTTEVQGSAGGLTPGRALRPRAKVLPEHARSHNRSLVLQTLYRDGQRSRADLARETGLTRVTVSDLVAELLAEGLVIELGQRESARPGKPAVLLDIDRAAHQIIGVDLSDHDRFRGAVMDLDGRILARAEVMLADGEGGESATGESAAAKVDALVDRLVAATTAPVLGIGVGSPGVVDLTGTILTAPNLGWDDLPLQQRLAARTGLPVVVANDANAAALAEHTYGGAAGDMMLIRVGHGIGAGLLVAGALVYGSHFAAGEIGQVMVGTDLGLETTYNRDQVLEHWLSVPQLQRGIRDAEAAGVDATPILREAGRRLGIALAPVVGALNLSEIVLSGPTELLDGPLAEATVHTLRNRTMAQNHADLSLRMTTQGQDIVLRGAAVLVLSGQLGVS
ncbi:Sugar kinase of the NBD/HSP70 family, may contain an N-terminal HTH domain [Leifsonia sp. 98AMF]|uniref:ROK family transcriptional regulator n=1 Tax=unclassified Leifsonia TaxID=2663824 RepID=UPI00087A2A60|nr:MULTISPECIES: ROK family transcriptional regulator [unclassified Leifsonia]SDH55154.1 Sugar kinase of the NBD/HSP70 family, may contain an N-terminal HTH domain [Leifsonia sp. 197AMF]SDI83543.1 Sugar kinase of the NBD/HSP70 family, may contain an N-terminal HTH domain [Leifsonia sp. 466MF]SDJ99991.1 Sugar kinase of the NBD/HSP70 family, may contain an N-terminal HTH domain [Leifsonia sp. 157MF]SDN86777.1 Sugar kinase of the NBD/HSP70 family, may contain an N-terminal HTH domain [Leifsonia sp